MKRVIALCVVLGGLLVIASMLGAHYYVQSHITIDAKRELTVNGRTIIVEVVNTPDARALGLSGRESLGLNEGMLFLFDRPDRHVFWMKDMRFPIDIVWIKNKKVVEFIENVDPQIGAQLFELKLYEAPEPISEVLELRAGGAQLLNLKVGDEISTRSLIEVKK